VLAVLLLCSTGAACRAQGSTVTPVGDGVPGPEFEDDRLAIVFTDDGLAAVPVGSSVPSWVVRGAVAAPDGSAAFNLRPHTSGSEVTRVDLRTGAEEPVGTLPDGPVDRTVKGSTGLRVVAVEPGGGEVVLAAGDGASTVVLGFDPAGGTVRYRRSFEGRLEPEALSVDRQRLFAARYYGDRVNGFRYHVHVLELADGVQYPTVGRDKTAPPEDMYGSVVQAALSPDGTQLATLYEDLGSTDHTAFVHLLDLEAGQTVCIDLHAPFGAGAPGSEAIEWRDDGTVEVGYRATKAERSVSATFDPEAIWSGEIQQHYHADARPDPAPPTLPDGVAATPGFRRFIATVD
jgi:hypothetical protein